MPDPFSGVMGAPIIPGPMGGMMQMMQSFTKFANAFKGNPKQKVQELLNSGRMSQEQFNQLQQMAKQFQQMMPH